VSRRRIRADPFRRRPPGILADLGRQFLVDRDKPVEVGELRLGGALQGLVEAQVLRFALFRDSVKRFDSFGAGRRPVDAHEGLRKLR